MTRLWRPFLAAVAAAALSACAMSDGVYVYNACWTDNSDHVKGVDWSQARLVDVAIVNGGEFSPSYLKLKQDAPHILRITNTDTTQRLFRARSFFRAVAIDKVTVANLEYPERCISAINVPPKATAEVRLVPVDQGKYDIDDGPMLVTLWFPLERNFGLLVVN